MQTEDQAILRHDLQAALLNHSSVHKEIHDCLQQLNDVLLLLVPSAGDVGAGTRNSDENGRKALLAQVEAIVKEDIDQCLPMLQLSSDRLSALLRRLSNRAEAAGS